jgi:predicted RNA binding protein YcfA (HicA-like mRNA interferase family)
LKLVPVSGKEFCKIVERAGFVLVRQKGSHRTYRHPDGRVTRIPVHDNELLGKGLILAILEQTNLSRNEYDALR